MGEAEWTLVREGQFVEGRVFSGPNVAEPIVVVPKRRAERAEAQRDRLAEALREIVRASKRGIPGSSLAVVAREALSVLDRETPDGA